MQTITGCSRRGGKRRTIETLQRRNLEVADLTTRAITEMRGGIGSGVVDEHGSIA